MECNYEVETKKDIIGSTPLGFDGSIDRMYRPKDNPRYRFSGLLPISVEDHHKYESTLLYITTMQMFAIGSIA
jgi:hypothetical protein